MLGTSWRACAFGMVCSFGLAAGVSAAQVTNADVTAAGDPVVGVAAAPGSATSAVAVAGTVAGVNNFPSAESPPNAFDNLTSTKYLNFIKTNTGFITTLLGNGPSAVLNGFRLSTANDAPERDPLTVTIEGTNAANPTAAAGGAAWTLLYNGTTGLTTDPGRLTAGPAETFSNTLAFNTYRVLVTGVRNASTANSMQFGEIELIGSTVPEPGTAGLVVIAALGMLGRRRR